MQCSEQIDRSECNSFSNNLCLTIREMSGLLHHGHVFGKRCMIHNQSDSSDKSHRQECALGTGRRQAAYDVLSPLDHNSLRIEYTIAVIKMMSLSAGKGGENWRKFAQMKIYLFSLLAALSWQKRTLKWQLALILLKLMNLMR